jgi:hypothetical protein
MTLEKVMRWAKCAGRRVLAVHMIESTTAASLLGVLSACCATRTKSLGIFLETRWGFTARTVPNALRKS